MSEQESQDPTEGFKKSLEAAAQAFGFDITEWSEDADYTPPRPTASVGRVRILEDDPNHGLYAGTEGELWLNYVGDPAYGNSRVMFWYVEDGYDQSGGVEVTDPLGMTEPI